MPAITKRVNINAPVAVKTIEPPIYGYRSDIIMRSSDILKCLCKRAIVDEILPNGKTVRLNMTNYYTDNGAGLYVTKETEKEAPKKLAPESSNVKETPKKKAVEPKKEEPPIKFAEDKESVVPSTEETTEVAEKHIEGEVNPPEESVLTEEKAESVETDERCVIDPSELMVTEGPAEDDTKTTEKATEEVKPVAQEAKVNEVKKPQQNNKNTSKNKSKKK